MTSTTASRLQAIVDEHGPWTGHDILLPDGTRTMPEVHRFRDNRLDMALATLEAIMPSFEGRTVLDLACLEGLFGLELAMRGAKVTFLDARASNLARTRFAADELGVDAEYVLADVRDIHRVLDGPRDLVICPGLLYHLDPATLGHLLAWIAENTGQVAIFETCIALEARTHATILGEDVPGLVYEENRTGVIPEEFTSFGNETSFWPTRDGLVRLLGRAGFGLVLEIQRPQSPSYPLDRVMLAAFPRPLPVPKITVPPGRPDYADPAPPTDRPRHPAQFLIYEVVKRTRPLVNALPVGLTHRAKRLLGLTTGSVTRRSS